MAVKISPSCIKDPRVGPSGLSSVLLNISREGDPTISPDNLYQYLVSLTMGVGGKNNQLFAYGLMDTLVFQFVSVASFPATGQH